MTAGLVASACNLPSPTCAATPSDNQNTNSENPIKKPNILVFQTDDQGHWAMGCAGNSEVQTPAMDWLAKEGAFFKNAFTPSPVCSAARACFWTGKIPSAHGVHDHVDEMGSAKDFPGVQGQTTLADLLHSAGYATGFCGKWHCGMPWKKPSGFDLWFTSAMGTNSRFGKQAFFDQSADGEKTVDGEGHQAPYYTERALRFLRERPADQPFFLYVGYTNPHGPFSGEPERLVSRYRDASFRDIPDEPYPEAHGKALGAPEKERKDDTEALAQYYAAIHTVDEQVGAILDELESRGELDNTIIVYTADHGHMNWHHRLFGKGNATLPQNFLEESIRVPMIVRFPEKVKAGQVRTENFDHCDLHATLLDAAGIGDKESGNPGLSIWDHLATETSPPDCKQAQFCEYGNARMILKNGLKLIVRYPGPNGHFPDELYDLNTDPRETKNLFPSAEYQPKIAELRKELEAWFARHETEKCSGKTIATQPRCNTHEVWTLPK